MRKEIATKDKKEVVSKKVNGEGIAYTAG